MNPRFLHQGLGRLICPFFFFSVTGTPERKKYWLGLSRETEPIACMYVYTHTHTHTRMCIYTHIHIYGVDGLDAKSCLTLWDPVDCSPPGSSLHWIFQARILEWVAIPYSTGSSWPRDWTRVSCLAGGFFITEPHEKSLLEILLDLKGEMCLSCWVQRPVFLR